MATEIGEGTVNVAKMVVVVVGGGGVVVTCCFGSQTQAGTNHPTLVREPSSPLTCSSQCKLKDVTELPSQCRFTVIDAVRYKQNAGVGGKSFDARDELDDITTRGLESGRKAKGALIAMISLGSISLITKK